MSSLIATIVFTHFFPVVRWRNQCPSHWKTKEKFVTDDLNEQKLKKEQQPTEQIPKL